MPGPAAVPGTEFCPFPRPSASLLQSRRPWEGRRERSSPQMARLRPPAGARCQELLPGRHPAPAPGSQPFPSGHRKHLHPRAGQTRLLTTGLCAHAWPVPAEVPGCQLTRSIHICRKPTRHASTPSRVYAPRKKESRQSPGALLGEGVRASTHRAPPPHVCAPPTPIQRPHMAAGKAAGSEKEHKYTRILYYINTHARLYKYPCPPSGCLT